MSKEKNETKVGIIGQMYEDRKTGKIGVLEERQEKYRTLMLRDKEGKSFNITYSTFKSNWRKYQGKEVIQTSAQKDDIKQEEKKKVREHEQKVQKAKKELSEIGDKPKLSREDKLKALMALKDVVKDVVEKKIPNSRVTHTMRGGVKVYYKRKYLIGLYPRTMENKITLDTTADIANLVDLGDIEVEKIVHEGWHISTKLRFSDRYVNDVLKIFMGVLVDYVNNTYIANEKTKETKEEKK